MRAWDLPSCEALIYLLAIVLVAEHSNVREDAGGGNLETRARAAHDERVSVIPLGAERNKIVRALERSKRRIRGHHLQANLDSLVWLHDGRVAKLLALRVRGTDLVRKVAVELREAVHELIERERCKLFGIQGLHDDVSHLTISVTAELARENHGLASNVRAREVVTRVGLGEAERLCLGDNVAEAATALESAEDVAQGARELALDARHLVARVEKAVCAADHRKASAAGGLVANELRALDEGLVPVERASEGLLVGQCDRDAAVKGRQEVGLWALEGRAVCDNRVLV
mmetsp:Transcript_23472/g.66746  ORF Transcript_23472/g.66746 Transcript_23472/m.66746 type:complete len:288 (+) Transcript_23472:405-1268(+)